MLVGARRRRRVWSNEPILREFCSIEVGHAKPSCGSAGAQPAITKKDFRAEGRRTLCGALSDVIKLKKKNR
ncbi:hypothetical protein EVAR_74150_1 [Eumeta japonica]|uniref:Uncharacterized protein n=1 Tax=Eumeta variegata TaxID=151549 RepID=A0A4C1SYI5_EUMVA|nr:hypothetical protein EVAR_74150_1 [Eumeta japonica]